MLMKDRIKQYIEYKGITAGELAVMLEVQRSNISHILNGRNKPGASFIEKLLVVFPDLNARWLLTGNGNMVEGTPVAPEPVIDNKIPFTPFIEPEEKVADKVVVEKEQNVTTAPVGKNDNVEKMILLFKDGTFATYNNRGNQ